MPTASCPECDEDVYVDEIIEQSELVTCDDCGEDLVVVGLDPIELDLYEDDGFDEFDEKDFDSYD